MADLDHSPPLAPRHWPTWLGIGVMALLARLPWPLQRSLGRALGALLRTTLPRRRDIAARNIALCFPGLDATAREALLRRHFAAIGIGLFEFARAWWGSVAPLRRGLVVEGLEHVHAARADGRGVIVVSGHFTTLEVAAGDVRPHPAGRHVPAACAGGHGMGGAPRRRRYAAAMFPKQDLRGAVRHLKRGGLLWYAPTRTRAAATACSAVLRPAAHSLKSTTSGGMSRGGGSPAARAPRRRRLHAAAFPRPPDIRPRTRWPDTAEVMAAIETMARAAPEQYLWIHRRFKRRPDGGSVY